MKKLNISAVSGSVAMPVKSGTLQFLQDAHKEALNGVIQNLIKYPIQDKIYILAGCVNSGTLPAHNISAGVLYLNGEVYDYAGGSFSLTGLNKAYARIETTQYLTNADPVEFTDGNSRNVHDIRKMVIEATQTSSGLAEFGAFITVGHWKDADALLQTAINTLNTTATSLQAQITALQNGNSVKNRGFFVLGDINVGVANGGTYPVSGDITVASKTSEGGGDVILITMANAMTGSYKVHFAVESLGTIGLDNDLKWPVFKSISSTQFRAIFEEDTNQIQNIKIHIDVIAI
jgi:hypothetical protein